MASVLIPGSSEPDSIQANGPAPSSLDTEDDRQLSAVPQHPHIRSNTTSSSSSTKQRRQLSPANPNPISRSVQHAGQDSETATYAHAKRKSIGSKLLSKFKHHASDDKAEVTSALHSQLASGAQTPRYAFNDSGSDAELGADKLQRALTMEQKRSSKTKQASSGSMDGFRHRGAFRGKSKQAHHDSDIEQGEDHRDTAEAPRYIAEQPTDLDRFRSNATRHLPGGLYDADITMSGSRTGRPAAQSIQLDRRGSKRSEPKPHQGMHLYTSAGEKLDEMYMENHQQEYDSDDSDDTIAHLIREADGYDSLRYNQKGKLSAGLDFDTLHVVGEKERSISDNRDAQSSHSAHSGGAAKALSQPLLQLEDIELETFLQNFARHTKEVTVTRPAEMQKYRMPKWSDFRVSPEGDVTTNLGTKRPSMLTRVDRGLHHLSDTLNPQNLAKGGSKGRAEEQGDADMHTMPRSGSAEDELIAESASDVNDHDTKHPTPYKKKSKSKALKKHKSANSKATLGDEDWGLIVPSSGDAGSYDAVSPHDELRVDAQDEGVDGVAFCIAYILALVERLAPEEIDHHPDRGYREGLIRSHLERLYTIAPFWEQLAFRIRRLYRWEDPKTSAAAAMIYFVLWYTNMIPTAFILTIMFYIMRFKYFPPSESYLHDKVKMRMARGQAANTLSEKLRRRSRLDILNIYKRWVLAVGAPTQEAMGLVADFHEKVKNLILWRNSAATRRTLILFGVLNLFVTFAPSQYVSKAIFFFLGITFFCLLPLQSYFPSHRKALSPLWWATFGAPTDAQFAVQLLRKRHLDVDRFAGQLNTAEDVRRAVRSQNGNSSKLKPRPDRREEGIAYDQIEDPSRASLDYVEMSNDATLKPRKLGSFFCQYKGLPGRLHVNTKYLYFTPLHSPSYKRGRTPVNAIESIVKTKSIRLWVWSSLGLKIVRNNGKAPLMFANLPNRDEAFNLILAVSTNAGAKAC
ncbi:uncharacterized protein MEPE_01529 [Melanopsichium pennsylvanicum]|uniref:Uncharacterized protein n=1 Tax=Melanopsichium pennsylvanicum TaxID=63383 RepID=A0AAJ4XKK8_9BASI|nr:uncharacterized protein MEPE_01529 [Melanopsichium pennsylvanicum]